MQETQETWVQPLGQEDPLEEGMATHSNVLAWRIPWIEERFGLQFMGSQRVRHNWSDLACMHTHPSNYSIKKILHCVYVPQLSYPFVCWWTSRLLPCPAYCKQSCYEHWGTRERTHVFLLKDWNSKFLILDKEIKIFTAHCLIWHELFLPIFLTSLFFKSN